MISSPTSALNLMFKNCFFRFWRGSEQTLCCWRHRNYAIFIGELKMGCCWYPKVIGQYDLARCLHNCDFGDDEGTVDEIDEHSKMICYWRRLLPISLSPFTLAASVSTSFRRIDITLWTRHKSHHQWLIDLTLIRNWVSFSSCRTSCPGQMVISSFLSVYHHDWKSHHYNHGPWSLGIEKCHMVMII